MTDGTTPLAYAKVDAWWRLIDSWVFMDYEADMYFMKIAWDTICRELRE